MRIQWGAAAIDLALVIVFVLIGRASHDEGATGGGSSGEGATGEGAVLGALQTLWPFLVGLAAGWLISRAWRAPARLKTGLIIWPVTVVVGMLLRALTGQGVQLSFIIVTTLVLGAFLVGWRLIAKVVKRR